MFAGGSVGLTSLRTIYLLEWELTAVPSRQSSLHPSPHPDLRHHQVVVFILLRRSTSQESHEKQIVRDKASPSVHHRHLPRKQRERGVFDAGFRLLEESNATTDVSMHIYYVHPITERCASPCYSYKVPAWGISWRLDAAQLSAPKLAADIRCIYSLDYGSTQLQGSSYMQYRCWVK